MGRVSQWGPNAQGVRSRPDRSVSLRDVRDLPVQRAGFNFDEFDRLLSEGTSEAERTPWDLVEDPKTGELVERGSTRRGRSSHPGLDLSEVVARHLEEAGEAVWTDAETVHGEIMDEILEGGTPMEDPSDLVWDEIEGQLESEISAEATGLTADQAFQQHKAASGYSMMGKRPDSKQGYFPGFGGPNESIEKDIAESKENVRPRTPEEQAAWEREQKVRNSPRLPVRPPPPLPPPVSQMAGPDYAEGEYATSNWWDSVPGLDDLPDSGFDEEGVADFDPWDPELRSMDSQMLADMVAARAAQPDEGYFGGMGEAVQGLTARVAEMSGTERAALISALVAAGLLTVGSGGVLAPAGAALLGGAGMAAMNP